MKSLHDKIREIINDEIDWDMGDRGKVVERLEELFREMGEAVIGKDEKPEDYVAKHLTEIELSMALQAVKFNAQNSLRSEQRERLAKLLK